MEHRPRGAGRLRRRVAEEGGGGRRGGRVRPRDRPGAHPAEEGPSRCSSRRTSRRAATRRWRRSRSCARRSARAAPSRPATARRINDGASARARRRAKRACKRARARAARARRGARDGRRAPEPDGRGPHPRRQEGAGARGLERRRTSTSSSSTRPSRRRRSPASAGWSSTPERVNVNGGAIALGPPHRVERRAHPGHAGLGDEGPRRPARHGGALHRRRPGHRHGRRALKALHPEGSDAPRPRPLNTRTRRSCTWCRSRRATSAASSARARKDWDAVEARVCLAFPDVYDIGMSHLGFKILYKILNDDPRTLAERAYAPWVDMEAQLRARGLPLVSCESARPLCATSTSSGFSLQFELTYTNVLAMLDLGRHPAPRATIAARTIRSSSRAGPTATHPEPLAPFLDAFVIGDGEERTTEVALVWTRAGRAGASRGRAPPRARAARGRLRARRSTRRASTPTPGFTVVDAAAVARGAAAGRAHARRRPEPLPLPRRRPDRRPRGHLRPHVDRDRARLHRGVPLLPGRDDLPPRPRARSRADRRDGRAAR